MRAVFYNKRIAGILGILPETVRQYEDEVRDGRSERNQKIKKNMGYGQRYRAKRKTTVKDFCVTGLRWLLDHRVIQKEEIGAIVVVTFTPDYFAPQVSNLIQAECGLAEDIFTLDIWGGCAGYLDGLYQAYSLLDMLGDKKVLLFTGDTINRMNKWREKFHDPQYGGDGACVTILENTKIDTAIHFLLNSDGKEAEQIAFMEGAFYDMFHQGKKKRKNGQKDANAAFRYFQKVVPEAIKELLDYAELNASDMEHFFFIQANRFSIQKFADRLRLPYEKVTMDLVEKYGDMSATLNPIGMIDWYQSKAIDEEIHRILICGYGAGMKWGGMVLGFGRLECCEKITTSL